MESLPTKSAEKIAKFREQFIDDLPDLAREYIDTARAEKTTAAMEKVLNTALKVIDGLQVDAKANPYANLPTINFVIGPGMQISATVEAPPALVEEVTPRVASPFKDSASADWDMPADPLDLLPMATNPDEAAVLADLASAAGAMALPDDE